MGIGSVFRASPCAVGALDIVVLLLFFFSLVNVFWEEEITRIAAWRFTAHLGGYPWHYQLIVHMGIWWLAHPHEFFCSA